MTSARPRIRIRFSKTGKIRWTSHRDVARMWERAFRRVDLPLAYSEGFSPRPRVSFGLALPTGYESVAEYLDVELASLDGIEVDRLITELSAALPAGVEAVAISILEAGAPSLQEEVEASTWRWLVVDEAGLAADLSDRIDRFLAAEAVVVTRSRKGREVSEDIRSGVEGLRALPDPGWLEADLATRPVSVRPSDVTAAFGGGLEERDVRRTHQWISRHGARTEPLLPVGRSQATEAPHALERAS